MKAQPNPLPRGIWFETKRKRYRVRKYRNGQPHLVYCRTEEAARAALRDLEHALKTEPKKRGARMRGTVPAATFDAVLAALRKAHS